MDPSYGPEGGWCPTAASWPGTGRLHRPYTNGRQGLERQGRLGRCSHPGSFAMVMRRKFRVSFIGHYRGGLTGPARSLFLGLLEQGHVVQEFDVGRRRDLMYTPRGQKAEDGVNWLRLAGIRRELHAFRPEVVLLAGAGLAFNRQDLQVLKRQVPVVGINLDGLASMQAALQYGKGLTVHATTSAAVAAACQAAGHDNVLHLPYAADARFFVPRPVVDRYRAAVAVFGQADSKRLATARTIDDHLALPDEIRLFGRGWDFNTLGPVRGEQLLQALWSTQTIVQFPNTNYGQAELGPGVFEGTAAGRLLFAPYTDELRPLFRYGEEIIGYADLKDLLAKLQFYLQRPEEAAAIALAGQRRCARDHTWWPRLDKLFQRVQQSGGATQFWPVFGSGPALRFSQSWQRAQAGAETDVRADIKADVRADVKEAEAAEKEQKSAGDHRSRPVRRQKRRNRRRRGRRRRKRGARRRAGRQGVY